jgi:putative SOS response-associated peptidase YedK
MCGRYRLSRRKQILAEHFDAVPFEDDWEPRYNIAPTQPVPVIRQTPNFREITLMRWGLIPSWATDPSIGSKTINARSETITTTASFRDPSRTRRCLIPADGFYEWVRHEVACVTVRRDHSFGPAVPSAVLYEVGRLGNELSRSPRTM